MNGKSFKLLLKLVLMMLLFCPAMLMSQFITLTIPHVNGNQGATVDVPVQISGISLADSLVSYQLTIWYDFDVVRAVGATRAGTMTQNWSANEPFTGTKTDTIRVADLTTNQPNRRLVWDAGILVKLRFVVCGNPGDNTQIRIVSRRLFDLDGEMNVSNVVNGSLTVTQPPVTENVNVTLHPNWNLISFRVMPQDNDLPDIFNGLPIDHIIAHYSGEGKRSWDRERYLGGYPNDLQDMDGLHGYWVYLNAGQQATWTITGNRISVNTPIPLYSNWNLVSYLPSVDYSLSYAFQSLNPLYSFVFGFEGGGVGKKSWDRIREQLGYPNDLTRLYPNFGYWVRMDSARALVYPLGGGLMRSNFAVNRELCTAKVDSFPEVIKTPWACDFFGRQEDIFTENDTLEAFDPDGILCGKVLVVEGSNFLVHVYGDDPNTPEADEGAENGDPIWFAINGDSLAVVGGDNIWVDRGSKLVELAYPVNRIMNPAEGNYPESFALLQNYPNPFNASTMISFILHAPSSAALRIFDETGRLVRTLLEEQPYGVGQHRIHWDGYDDRRNRVSSGIYICQLNAGHTRRSIKLILMN